MPAELYATLPRPPRYQDEVSAARDHAEHIARLKEPGSIVNAFTHAQLIATSKRHDMYVLEENARRRAQPTPAVVVGAQGAAAAGAGEGALAAPAAVELIKFSHLSALTSKAQAASVVCAGRKLLGEVVCAEEMALYDKECSSITDLAGTLKSSAALRSHSTEIAASADFLARLRKRYAPVPSPPAHSSTPTLASLVQKAASLRPNEMTSSELRERRTKLHEAFGNERDMGDEVAS